MKKMFYSLAVGMLLATGVSHAAEQTPPTAAYSAANSNATPGDTFTDPKAGMELVHVKGGCFCMGAAERQGAHNAVPERAHQVCLDDYYVSKYEVTQGQWRAIMGSNPSMDNGCGDNCPAVGVSWNEAQEFMSRLSKLTGKTFRLPTEAEWEYAARDGGMTASSVHAAGSEHALRPVAVSQPNGLGIYDMQGSVWEWTADRYTSAYNNNGAKSPEVTADGNYRVLRGGSWVDNAGVMQPTFRIKYEPWIKREWVGFRVSSPDQNSPKRLTDVLSTQSAQCGAVQEAAVR